MKLFRPLWDSKNEKRAVKAVEKIKDEAKLARVVEEARCLQARETAAEKLTDQNLIILLLQKNKITYNSYIDKKIRFTLAKKLDDTNKAQQILSEIAANLSDSYSVSQSTLDFGNAVLDCITEQSALFYVAGHGRISQIYKKAIERLTDTNLLYELAKERGYDKGHLAIQKLNDQKLLEDLAINDKEMSVRFWAAQKLTNQSLAQPVYADVVQNAKDDKRLKMEAAKLLEDQSLSQQLYESIAINSDYNYYKDIALEAVSLLNEQKLLGNVVNSAKNYAVCEAAAKKLIDQNVLKEIALKTTLSDYIREIVVEKLTNQPVLAEIAKSNNNITVKTAAIKNFDNTNLQLIPEIVENFLSIHHNYSNEEVNNFIQLAYKVSQQEQKQVLYKYEGKILPHIDSHSDSHDDNYADYCGDGAHTDYRSSYHTDRPEITICF